MQEDRERLNVLLKRKFLTKEEIQELNENMYVVRLECLGDSGNYEGYNWYDANIIDEGYLPDDENYTSTRYDIYEKRV